METDVPVGFCVDTAAVRRGRTFFLTGAGTHFATGEGTAPFTGMLLFTVPPVDHTEPGHAQGCAVFIDGDRARNGIRAAAVGIKVNKRSDVPFLAESISGIVVMGGIQTDVPDGDIRVDRLKFVRETMVLRLLCRLALRKRMWSGRSTPASALCVQSM